MRETLAIEKNADMFAQASLFIEHIVAHLRILREQAFKNIFDGFSFDLDRLTRRNPFQPAREMHFRHLSNATPQPAPLSTRTMAFGDGIRARRERDSSQPAAQRSRPKHTRRSRRESL